MKAPERHELPQVYVINKAVMDPLDYIDMMLKIEEQRLTGKKPIVFRLDGDSTNGKQTD